jgi:hypothetical protein
LNDTSVKGPCIKRRYRCNPLVLTVSDPIVPIRFRRGRTLIRLCIAVKKYLLADSNRVNGLSVAEFAARRRAQRALTASVSDAGCPSRRAR